MARKDQGRKGYVGATKFAVAVEPAPKGQPKTKTFSDAGKAKSYAQKMAANKSVNHIRIIRLQNNGERWVKQDEKNVKGAGFKGFA